MARPRRHSRPTTDIWPGFVDALSTLLLVSIFLLSVFVLAQFFLSQLLQGRDERLLSLQQELGLVRGERNAVESELARVLNERAALELRVAALIEQNRASEQDLALSQLDAATAEARRRVLEQALQDAEGTIAADRATIEAQLDELDRLAGEVATLAALRDRLDGQIAEQAALLAQMEEATAAQDQELADVEAARAALRAELGRVRDRALMLEADLAEAGARTLAAQRARSAADAEAARTAEAMAALTAELGATRAQLARIESLLADREARIEAQDVRIEDLDTRLAAALAREVDELQRFRSDFFGRLREVLGNRTDVRVVGDRFVFQSEVLFDRGAATLGAPARAQLAELATTLREVTADLPDDLPWILQINGHTDRRPISTFRFPSNWELSTARAISVARYLIEQGIPADRVAAAGFAANQPLDPADTEAAYQGNRRIEIKLTTQ